MCNYSTTEGVRAFGQLMHDADGDDADATEAEAGEDDDVFMNNEDEEYICEMIKRIIEKRMNSRA